MINRIKLEDLVGLMQSSSYKERFIAEYIQTKQRHEKLKRFNTKIEAATRTQHLDNGVDEPLHDCPAGLLREQQAAMGEYLHLLEVRAVIEDIDLEDTINYYIQKALKAERECFNACECKTAEEIEREKTCCQKDCAPSCEEGIYGPSEEDLPEGILSLEETVEVCERCLFLGEGTDTCSDCIIRDRCGDMVRDRSVIYHLKKYAEHK